MAEITLDRDARLIWAGTPFSGLKNFNANANTTLHTNPNGSPTSKTVFTPVNVNTAPDLIIPFGSVHIPQNGSARISAAFGPFVFEGDDSLDYCVWWNAPNRVILAEEEELVIELIVHVTALT